MTATYSGPSAADLDMIAYQEDVFQQIADRFGLSLSEVGVIAATFLRGLGRREMIEVRRAARQEYAHWTMAQPTDA